MFLLVFGLREQDRVDGTQTFIVNMYSKSKVRKYEEWLANLRCLFPTPRLLGRDGRELNHNNRRHGHITQIVPNSSSPFTHFLAAVGGQVEHEHGEKGDAHAGYYEVDSVEERLAPHRDVESNIEVGLGAACVIPETRRSKSVTYSTPTWQSR